ncbi:MAG TPA: LysM domain-containing protein [Solirubrobacteraceae bacterium]|nr:LysM domain-containing protein [Solirubrobacteraceae bacterium]
MFRSPARLFAPLALVACAVAVLVIVGGGSGGGGGSKSTSTATGSSTTSTTQRSTKHHKRTYIVKNGDVLSQIAIKTGVPLETIQQLNPTVDAQSLHAGQKIKLAP